ncbi:MAG: sigma-70 family RNA polymerase sigma factor [Corynebacterium sp.]|nr:sigma-70 family RNA polymerase sigma factor [Corynebacterium sp.]
MNDNEQRITSLALAAGAGDADALTEFIRLTINDVWRFLAHLASPQLADDLTQETYLRVISALPRFAGRSSAMTWLLTLARRVWIDQIRHDRARPAKSATEYEDVHGSTPDEFTDLVESRLLLAGLSDERREAIVLTQVLGYSYEEAAQIAGVRVGTIRSRVARARQDLASR